jgi:hypothetical protein
MPPLHAIHADRDRIDQAEVLRVFREHGGEVPMLKAGAERSRKLFEQLYIEPMKQQLYVWERKGEWQDKIEDQSRVLASSSRSRSETKLFTMELSHRIGRISRMQMPSLNL